MSPGRPALAFALVLLLLAPASLAQSEVPQPTPETPQQIQCQPPVETCLPDLLPTNPTFESVDERTPGRACTDFINLGEGPSAQPFRILLRIDGIPTSESQATGAYNRGEGGANICWDDILLPAGRHRMSVFVDSNSEVIEENEDNNIRTLAFVVKPAPRVDLIITDFYVTPKKGGVGVNQLFIFNVTNIGDAGSPATNVRLSDDLGEMANWTIPGLAPGASTPIVHVTRPEYKPVGTFVARAVIDPSNELDEISETNNEALLEYTVLEHPAPDYNITRVVVAGNRTEMRGVRVDVTVENMGDRAARGTTVRIVNETNALIAQGVTTSIMYPGSSAVVQFYLVMKAGNHSLKLIADPNNKVAERDETNNEWPVEIEIVPSPFIFDRPNLITERVYAMPEDPRPGEAVSVGALIHNIGTNKSNATTISFHIGERKIGTAAIPSLRPDAYYSAYVPWVATEQGTYTIIAVADPGDTLPEIDEDDNALSLEFLITTMKPPPIGPPPDEEPPVVTPTPPTSVPTPKPTTPTPPSTPTDTSTASRVVFGDLVIATQPAPGGAKGVLSVSLRNPSIEAVPRLLVTFKVDGELVKEVLVSGIRGAASTAATSGEIALPAGKHTASAEVRIVGSTGASIVREKVYEQEAGAKEGIPGLGSLAFLAAIAMAVALRARRARH